MNKDMQPDTANLDAMLAKVRTQAESECSAVASDARAEAEAILKRAHKDARIKVHEAVEHERRAAIRDIGKMQARIDTDKRQRLQTSELTYLDEAWKTLRDTIQQRWDDPEDRAQWVASVVTHTAENLQPGSWVIEHPEGWDTKEMDPHLDSIEDNSGDQPAYRPDASMSSGLRVHVGEAVLDASPGGILADQDHISALLLAELFQVKEQSSDDALNGEDKS